MVRVSHLGLTNQNKCQKDREEKPGLVQVLRTHRDTLLSVLETLVHDPLVEWVPKNAKSGAEEQENAMARDAMATIEGETPSFDHVPLLFCSALLFPKPSAKTVIAVTVMPILCARA